MRKNEQEMLKEGIQKDILQKRFDNIDRNKEHDEWVHSIFMLFNKGDPLREKTGFRQVKLEPLFDLDDWLNHQQCKNFDMLIHNQEIKHSIFIEVKSSLNSGIGQEIKNFQKCIETLEKRFYK